MRVVEGGRPEMKMAVALGGARGALTFLFLLSGSSAFRFLASRARTAATGAWRRRRVSFEL